MRQRLELQHAHQEHQELKAKKVQAEREEEEAFRQRMMAKFAEDDRIEQMNAQRRRMKQLGTLHECALLDQSHVGSTSEREVVLRSPCYYHTEHRRAVEALIEERRRKFQEEKEAELEERREEERREGQRRAIIEQERQRLLREHASKLLGYLPKVGTSPAYQSTG